MELNREQRAHIEQLQETESLTDNLTDTEARALLDWAQTQIASNADLDSVKSALSAANASGEAGIEPLLARAAAFLNTQVGTRGTPVQTPHKKTAPASDNTKKTRHKHQNTAGVDLTPAVSPTGSPPDQVTPAPTSAVPSGAKKTPRKKKRSRTRRSKK